MYICALHECSTHQGRWKALGSLELEFKWIVSYHMRSENQVSVPCKSNKDF